MIQTFLTFEKIILMNLQEILTKENYHLIDVREPQELISDGAIEGAENIPLGEIPNHIDEIKSLNGDIIIFCKSGMRSQKAIEILDDEGVENLINGGGYETISTLL